MKNFSDLFTDSTLETLNGGHKLVSNDLKQVLVFDLQRKVNVLKEQYELFIKDKGDFPDKKQQKFIELVLYHDISSKSIDKEFYEQMKSNLELVWWYLYVNGIEPKYKSMRFETYDKFVKDFGDVSSDVKSLNVWLEKNLDKNPHELNMIMKALPFYIEELTLGLVSLHAKPYGVIKEIFENLPKGLKSFSVRDTLLGEHNEEDIIHCFRFLPEGLRVLNVGGCSFGAYDFSYFFEILDLFPKGLWSLDLRGNELWKLEGGLLVEFIKKLPPELKYLGLADNELNKVSNEELGLMLSFLPKSVEYLKINYSSLNDSQKAIFLPFSNMIID